MLLLDLGNSSIKAQCWQGGILQSSLRIRITSNWLSRFKHYLSTVGSINCFYAGVSGSEVCEEVLACLSQKFDQQHTHLFKPLARAGIVVSAYPDPGKIGVDRWLALLGAANLTQTDAIVIDAGTAITVDLLKADGQHLGGAILPGFNTSLTRFRQILSGADFSHADIERIEKPGVTTESCIHINHDLEDTSYLAKLIDRWFNFLAGDAVLIVSGGDALRVGRHPQHALVPVPDLVFQGMRQQLEFDE